MNPWARVTLLYSVFVVSSSVLAQMNQAVPTNGESAVGPARPATVTHAGVQRFPSNDDVIGVPALAGGAHGRGGEVDCPPGYLAGQDQGACGSTQWYFYDDLTYCLTPPTTCQRVRCENFPDATHTITKPIGVISWTGIYVQDPIPDGCTKPEHLFRVRFYAGAAPDPNNPVASEEHDALATDTGRTVLLTGATVPATVWLFTFVLDNPVNLATGWFSVTGDGTSGCYHLWEGSAQGDNSIYQWFETSVGATFQHITDKCDLNYCFSEKKIGACCNDCDLNPATNCTDNASDVYCAGLGGRWAQDTLCANLSPPCSAALGACCHDDGTSTPTTCCECQACGQPCCLGDLNCDGTVNFGDINPFVLYLSNCEAWKTTFPDCSPCNGDLNCDGTYCQGAFDDINPFVALMTQCGSGCPCPGPFTCPPPWACTATPTCTMPPLRVQGDYWAGPGTTPDDCCTVPVPPGATRENEPDDCDFDTFNGGCNITPALFTPIENGWTVYGESGTFSAGDPPVNYRDLDWYQTTTTTPVSFTVTVEAEFDVIIWAARQGPNGPGDPCTGWRDVSTVVTPPADGHNLCTPVILTTRCLPAGTYWFVVGPATFSGVRCNSDYKITLEESGMCEVLNSCADCPSGSYVEGTNIGNPGYCDDEPADPDPNGGCNATPYVFEPLPHDANTNPDTFKFCGKLWANQGYRDLDWWSLDLPVRSQVQWAVNTEVPCRATMLFSQPSSGVYAAPTCTGGSYYWVDTLYSPCTPATWTGTMYYEATTADLPYFFLVMPEDATESIFYGYPCPMGGVDFGNDYAITMTVTGIKCENEILAKPVGNVEMESNCTDPPAYVDSYNSGCDAAAPPGPVLTLNFDAANAWRGRTFGVPDPNDPNAALVKDYDWYTFNVTGGNKRFKVYLYADFPVTWEIWTPNQCANDAGLIEGVEVPSCNDAGVYTRRCYVIGTYWLRVYPTSTATCGSYYYLALTEPGSCSLCSFSPSGTNLDDPCDDLTDFDTNAGCDDPNAPPPHYMSFACAQTYWGTIYAGLQGGLPYYDPDWFTITQTNATNRRLKLTVTAEFLAQVEVYLSCTDYDSGNPVAGLFGVTPLVAGTACPNVILTATTGAPQGTVFYGRITCVDQFQNLMTKYYPCAKGNNRWKVVTACIV
jgi:hypothetical protein